MGPFADIPVIDSHVHIGGPERAEDLIEFLDACGLKGLGVVCTTAARESHMAMNLAAATLKAAHPEQVYLFVGLHHSLPGHDPENMDFAAQAERLLKMGADGFKMIEGKTTVRKSLGLPLDAPIFDDFYATMESCDAPIIMHVADPEAFWDEKTIPKWAVEHGWFYGDGTYPTKEEQYSEVDRVLERFPSLRLILAHFYFLSADIERASRFLEKWPTVSFDITPGAEMYFNFSKKLEEWREFFVKYQDRIVFGTDTSAGRDREENLSHGTHLVESVRTFLETDGEMKCNLWKGRCLGLEEGVLRKIYADNFKRCAGDTPTPLDIGMAQEECERLTALAKKSKTKGELLPKFDLIRKGLLGLS